MHKDQKDWEFMLTAFIAAHGCKPLTSTWNLVYLWILEILPPFLQLLSLYLGAKKTNQSRDTDQFRLIKKEKMEK